MPSLNCNTERLVNSVDEFNQAMNYAFHVVQDPCIFFVITAAMYDRFPTCYI